MEIRAFKESHENVNRGLDIVLAQFQVATDISLHRSQKPTCSRFRLKLTRLFCVFHCDSSSSVVCYCAFVSERSRTTISFSSGKKHSLRLNDSFRVCLIKSLNHLLSSMATNCMVQRALRMFIWILKIVWERSVRKFGKCSDIVFT